MLDDVLERLLGHAVDGGLDVGVEVAVVDLDLGADLGREVAREPAQAGAEAEVVEQRGAQPADRGARLVEGGGGEVARCQQLAGDLGAPRLERVGGGAEVVVEADDALADAVVDLGGEPLPLGLLELQGVLGEALDRLLALGEPGVEPGVLDGAGHQVGDVADQAHLVRREVTAALGVDVEDPDEVAGPADHRHREQRRVVLAAQLGEVAVAGIAPLVLDHRGLAVERDPSRHPLADGELDGAGELVEGRRPSGEHQPAAGLVEHVDEADVGGGHLDHEPRQTAHGAVEVEPCGEGGDDPAEELVLLPGLRGGELARHLGAQWKRPSRSATATAWARSPTSSLR